MVPKARLTVRCYGTVFYLRKKKVKKSRDHNETPSQSYWVSLVIWDHSVLPAIRHKWTHPVLTLQPEAGIQFTYPGWIEGWVDLGDRLHTEMLYPPTVVTHQSTNPAVESNSRPVDRKSDALATTLLSQATKSSGRGIIGMLADWLWY